MRISELIKRLEELKAIDGDIDVMIWDRECEEDSHIDALGNVPSKDGKEVIRIISEND